MQKDILTNSQVENWRIRCKEGKWILSEMHSLKRIEFEVTSRIAELRKLIRSKTRILISLIDALDAVLSVLPHSDQAYLTPNPAQVLEDYIEFLTIEDDFTADSIEEREFMNPHRVGDRNTFSLLIPKVRIIVSDRTICERNIFAPTPTGSSSSSIACSSIHNRVTENIGFYAVGQLIEKRIMDVKVDRLVVRFENEDPNFSPPFIKPSLEIDLQNMIVRSITVGHRSKTPKAYRIGWNSLLTKLNLKLILLRTTLPTAGINVFIDQSIPWDANINFIRQSQKINGRMRKQFKFPIPQYLVSKDYDSFVIVERKFEDPSIDARIDIDETLLIISAIDKLGIKNVLHNSLFWTLYDLRIDI